MSKEKELIKSIAKVIKDTQKEIEEMYQKGTFDEPIKNDVELSLKTMAYTDIRELVKKYIKAKKNEGKE